MYIFFVARESRPEKFATHKPATHYFWVFNWRIKMIKEEYSKKYIGKKYGMLTIMSYSHRKSYHYFRKNGKERIDYLYFYKCKCDCGKEKTISINSILTGHTKSCGCLHIENCINKFKKHGKYRSKIYYIWRGIRNRCNFKKDKSYKYYGGMGIKVCDEWENDFMAFYNWAMLNGYKDGLTIDRIDVNGNYCPENCRWVDRKTQARNTRRNRFIEYNGEKYCLNDWARIVNKTSNCISYRLKKGWSIKDALYIPSIRGKIDENNLL